MSAIHFRQKRSGQLSRPTKVRFCRGNAPKPWGVCCIISENSRLGGKNRVSALCRHARRAVARFATEGVAIGTGASASRPELRAIFANACANLATPLRRAFASSQLRR
jgi:hypothetical protein